MLRSARKVSFVAASSLWKCPLLRTAFLTWLCSYSIAFVVYRILRTSSEKAKNGITSAQRRRQLATMAGHFWPQGPCSNSSRAAAAASALAAV